MSAIKVDNTINNRYQILSMLGKGGMATVYKALDKERGYEVALKALNADQLRLERRKDRFLSEYIILSKLDHFNIVKVFDQEVAESGEPFFTMECLNGNALSDDLKKIYSGTSESLSLNNAISILEQVAKALEYIHTRGIVYCDLKPANILVLNADSNADQDYSRLKLLDFGISRVLENQSDEQAASMVGTSYYMSPEQVRSEQLDARSDIYSFGVLAFELLTGHVPFNHEALFSVTASHLIGKVPSIRDSKQQLPKSIDRMIQICMEKEKEHRYSNMKDIFDRLEGAREQIGKPSLLKRLFGK